MKRLSIAVLFVALAAAGAIVLAQSGNDPPPNPHAFMDAPNECPACHRYWENQLEPHMFSVMIHDVCTACHAKLGRSHPININPRDSRIEFPDPMPLPVPYIVELGDDVISCGSCHNPHGDWLSTTRSFLRQQPFFTQTSGDTETLLYKTFYVRMSDPVDGFFPLCKACHPRF